jgi:glycosyltransferase involved in cell wall biosynthesis
MQLSVIVPARNEEDCIGECLRSLASSRIGLRSAWIGRFAVDDGSTDRTLGDCASAIDGVTVIEARRCPKGWTGKANAVWTGAQQAKGEWLLFTDADTVHEPGNLIRAMHEAGKRRWRCCRIRRGRL